MDTSKDERFNPDHHVDPKLEDEPADKSDDKPKDDNAEFESEGQPEDELSTQIRKRPQTPAVGPFSKPSGYLGPNYFHRQQKSFASQDSESEEQSQGEETDYETAEEGSEEGFEQGDKDRGQEGEDDPEAKNKNLEKETSEEEMPDPPTTDQDVITQARPGQEDAPVEQTSETASAQETQGQPTHNRITSTSQQPSAGDPAPAQSPPSHQKDARLTFEQKSSTSNQP